MKSTYFSNKKSLEIVSPQIRNDIKSLISNIGSFNLTSKYYTFLNKKNVNDLKDNDFLVSLSTFGKKFILFITKYNTKKYCIFINKKNDTMTVLQLKFIDDIFLGTLFDGELVKNSDNKWIYLINDIAYYKGENICTKSFTERQKIVDNILKNEYENENENQSFYISKKTFFQYKYIKDLVIRYMLSLNYKCSGLYFKSVNNFSDNYLFIFPECRSDSKILNMQVNEHIIINDTVSKVGKVDKVDSVSSDEMNDEDDLFKNVEKLKPELSDKLFKPEKNRPKLEKTTCRFLIIPTQMPDIYELYCKSSNDIEKYSYASVPDIETSNFLKNIIGDKYDFSEDINTKIKNDNVIYVECNYHKVFKKWIPYKKVDSMDNINLINQIQIILDSL